LHRLSKSLRAAATKQQVHGDTDWGSGNFAQDLLPPRTEHELLYEGQQENCAEQIRPRSLNCHNSESRSVASQATAGRAATWSNQMQL
jgi:hypothetical protein